MQWPGRFSFALPMSEGSAAMPSRLAMEISGKLMEGEVVNRSKAQRVYRNLVTDRRRQTWIAVDDVKKIGWAHSLLPQPFGYLTT